jgi:hypothetical protein
MAQNYNVGSDTTIVITANGTTLVSLILTSFEARQITTRLKSVAITGVNRYRELEEGWEGTLDWDRADSSLDDFFAAKEAGRYAGQEPPVIQFNETTTNPDGSISQFRYTGVTMKFESIGKRSGDAKVDQRVTWTCSRRKAVS